ncbi:MAG: PAS domain S-box protein [Bacteroidota bacterium]
MKDTHKTKAQLISEIEDLNRSLSGLQEEYDNYKNTQKHSKLVSKSINNSDSTQHLSDKKIKPQTDSRIELGTSELTDIIEQLEFEIEGREKAEKKFKEVLAQMYAVLDNIPYLAWLKDIDSKYVIANKMFAKSFGVAVDDIKGKTDYDFTKPFFADKYRKDDKLVIDTANHFYVEEIIEEHDGTQKILETFKAPVFNDNNEIIGTTGLARDISERIKIENDLKESEKKYRTLTDELPVGVYRITEDGKILFVNSALAEILGYDDTNQLSNVNAQDMFINPKDRIDYIRKMKLGEKSIKEVKFKTKDNNEIWVRITGQAFFRNESDKIDFIQGIIENITSRKLFENALLESELKFRTLFEHSAEAMLLLDGEMFTDCNNATLRMMKTKNKEAMLGKHPSLFSPEFQPDGQLSTTKANDMIQLAFQQGSMQFEWMHRNLVGEDFWVEVSLTALPIGGRQILFTIWNDISERKKNQVELQKLTEDLEKRVIERTIQLEDVLEELKYEIDERNKMWVEIHKAKSELEYSLKKERELNEMKSRFISMVSHEYRTPLTVILSSTYLLEKYFDLRSKDSFVNHLNKIQTSVKYMTKMLEDILAIGKAEIGKISTNTEEIDLVKLGHDIIAEIKNVDNNVHPIEFIYQKSNCLFYSDFKLMHQILTNLLSNACKYSKEKSIVRLELFDDTDSVKFHIIDFGIGIPGEEQNYIFHPFHRFRNVGTIPGTGLGLSIVKNSVDILKGTISFSSELNKGTIFTVQLPKEYSD